ncbi:MAG TPA: metallophosphoesterase [Nitrosopumilaceae archaeon]|nr:metallophosphoesterase [Nitrosopumilaceae archaeon]
MVQTRIVQSHAALILEEEKKHLVVSDLHIGFESTFAVNDIYIEPAIVVEETSNEIISIAESEKVDSLILLGDIKSGIDSISKIEWEAVPRFFEIAKKISTILIPGNHDGNIQYLLPDSVKVASSSGIVLGDTLLTHGHTLPSENLSHINKIIMGHVHPVFFQEGSVLDGQRVWVSLKVEKNRLFPASKGELEILIMPTFNKYFYANHKKYKKSISPILEHIKDFQSAKIVTLDGVIIGNESMLENVI